MKPGRQSMAGFPIGEQASGFYLNLPAGTQHPSANPMSTSNRLGSLPPRTAGRESSFLALADGGNPRHNFMVMRHPMRLAYFMY